MIRQREFSDFRPMNSSVSKKTAVLGRWGCETRKFVIKQVQLIRVKFPPLSDNEDEVLTVGL